MKFTSTAKPHGEGHSFEIEILSHDLGRLIRTLSPIERRLLMDTSLASSPPEDILLVLEMLFRKHSELEKNARLGIQSRLDRAGISLSKLGF